MLRSLLLPAMLAAIGVAAAPPKAEEAPKDETPGKGGWALKEKNDVPAPFHPYYVAGPHIARLIKENKDKNAKITGRFHSPVSHHGLDPMLLLFVREVNATEPLKDFIRRLDTVVEKNPNVRLGAAVVFISDKIEDVVFDDEARDEAARQLEDLAAELKLQRDDRRGVALCLDGKRDLEKWELGRGDATYVLVLLRDYKVVHAETISRDQLNAAKTDAVLQLLADKFGATRR
jgi:hypothetical protein